MLMFQTYGKPVAQGEPTPVARGVLKHLPSSGLKQWRAAVMMSAIGAAGDHDRVVYSRSKKVGKRRIATPIMVCFDEPVAVYATFWFKPLGRHVEEERPRVIKDTVPDLDKLYRAVGDSLSQANIISDDQRIVGWPANPAKWYWKDPGLRCAVLGRTEMHNMGCVCEAITFVHTPPTPEGLK